MEEVQRLLSGKEYQLLFRGEEFNLDYPSHDSQSWVIQIPMGLTPLGLSWQILHA